MAAGMRLDFDTINRAALASLPVLLRRWLPDGRLVGREFRRGSVTAVEHAANGLHGKWGWYHKTLVNFQQPVRQLRKLL